MAAWPRGAASSCGITRRTGRPQPAHVGMTGSSSDTPVGARTGPARRFRRYRLGQPRRAGGPNLLVAGVRRILPVVAVVAAQFAFFPMPASVWVQGAILGLLGSLMAVGLALVFRLNRIVNFAQGDLGSAPAVLAFGLIGFSGVGYLVGLATGLVASVVVTVAVEIVFVRRFTRSPRLLLTVVTIGISQALQVASLLIPLVWGSTPIGTVHVSFPWHLVDLARPLVFTSDHVVGVVVSVVALVGVAVWSRTSELGIATRATGDRRDRAAMLGIPVARLQTVTWVVAGVLSFLSVFLRAAIVGLPLDPTFSLIALAGALGALALGGFTDLPAVAAAAVAIGVLEQGIAWDQPDRPTLVLAVVAAVVVLGMLVRGAGSRPGGRPAALPGSLVSVVPDIAGRLRALPEVRAAMVAAWSIVLVALATLPLWCDPGTLLELSTLLVLVVVGYSIVVLTGWSGQVTLGQMSFAAVGGAAGAVALADWGWDLSLALLFAGAAGAGAAFLVGLPTLRFDGVFVAVTTLVFGLATSGYLLDRAQFGWIPPHQFATPAVFGFALGSQTAVYVTCLSVAVLGFLGLHGLRHSRTGRAWRAVSANERAAAGFGIGAARSKLSAFAVSGFIAGVAGCLLVAVNQQYVESPFTVPQSLAVLTATVVGGIGSATGAFAGAALIEGSVVFLPPSWQLLPSAFGVLLVLLAFPTGVAGAAARGRDRLLQVVARRHGMGIDHDGSDGPAPSAGRTPAVVGNAGQQGAGGAPVSENRGDDVLA